MVNAFSNQVGVNIISIKFSYKDQYGLSEKLKAGRIQSGKANNY
jgi:hypothetical protein